MDANRVHLKESGLRIRVENGLRQAFLTACQREDQTAAQVLRAFMRSYVEQKAGGMQPDLFRMGSALSEIKSGEDE